MSFDNPNRPAKQEMNRHISERSEDAFEAIQLASGTWTLRALAEGETFHPVLGAVRESRELYLEQLSLGQRWQQPDLDPLVIWDVGLGAAGNAVAVIRAWQEGAERDVELLSFDRHDHALRFALEFQKQEAGAFAELTGFDWEKILAGRGVEFLQGQRRLRWFWYLQDFPELLAGDKASALPPPEVVFYDVYSPAKCWSMWGLEHWKRMRAVCGQRDCEIVFHSRSTALRVTLLLAGFYVGRGVAVAEKEETTVAATRGQLLKRPLNADWLQRVQRSTAARPFTGESYEQGRISPGDFAQMAGHSQFAVA